MAEVTRIAACRCGALTAQCAGDPIRISVCHCLDCQRRSGSAFSVQARFPKEKVVINGEYSLWSAEGDEGSSTHFRFCPGCGTTIAFANDHSPDQIAVPVGTFADPAFPAPMLSIFEGRKHSWVAIVGDGIAHYD